MSDKLQVMALSIARYAALPLPVAAIDTRQITQACSSHADGAMAALTQGRVTVSRRLAVAARRQRGLLVDRLAVARRISAPSIGTIRAMLWVSARVRSMRGCRIMPSLHPGPLIEPVRPTSRGRHPIVVSPCPQLN